MLISGEDYNCKWCRKAWKLSVEKPSIEKRNMVSVGEEMEYLNLNWRTMTVQSLYSIPEKAERLQTC